MNDIIEEVKKNLEINSHLPLKLSFYEAFRKSIVSGQIPAGERINEKLFSERLNISRTPIRYALRRLAEEQLVSHTPKFGVVVRGVSIKDAHEIYDIRKALDSLAAVHAMQLMTEKDFETLRKHLETCEALNAANKVDDVLKNFSEFNEFIYEKSQMLRLKAIVTELKTYLAYFRDISIRAAERRHEALAEHWLIYRGMLNRDAAQITLVTHEHLDRSLSFILKEMERAQR